MNVVAGVVITLLALLAWGGQLLSRLAPERAAALGLCEAEDDVEPAFWADVRGEALWDALTLWTLVAAGLLLVLDEESWAYFGLVGGGVFVYFAGRGILTRLEMRQRGLRIGDPASVRTGLIALGVWGVMGLATIVAAVRALPT